MTDISTDTTLATVERNILSRMDYVNYLKRLMVNSQGAVKVKSFVEFSGQASFHPVDRGEVYGASLDQTELFMLIEAQADRVSQSLQMRQALGSLRSASLNAYP